MDVELPNIGCSLEFICICLMHNSSRELSLSSSRKGFKRYRLQQLLHQMAICMQGWENPLMLRFRGLSLNICLLMRRLVLLFLFLTDCWWDLLDKFHYVLYFQGSEFLRGFHSMDQNRFSDAWDDIQRPQIPHFQGRTGPTNLPLEHARLQQDFDGNFFFYHYFD